MNGVTEFFNQMDADMSEIREMDEADRNLAKAIERFERAFQRKLKVTYATTTNGEPNPD